MLFLGLGVLFIVGGFFSFLYILQNNKKYPDDSINKSMALIPTVAGIMLIAAASIYAQDIGETIVLRNMGVQLRDILRKLVFILRPHGKPLLHMILVTI